MVGQPALVVLDSARLECYQAQPVTKRARLACEPTRSSQSQ